MSAVTAACLVICRLQFNKGYDIYFVMFALIIIVALMIAICDIKYLIIPDQFTIALAVLGLAVSIYDIIRGYGILHVTWWSPLAGAAMGAAVMLLIDLIGKLIYKKEGMGFGDVKLFAAVGMITGFPGTILAFIISLISATICFCVIMVVSRILARKEERRNRPLRQVYRLVQRLHHKHTFPGWRGNRHSVSHICSVQRRWHSKGCVPCI